MKYHFNARYIRLGSLAVQFTTCLAVGIRGEPMPACPPSYVPYAEYCYAMHTILSERSYAIHHCKEAGEAWVGGGQLAKVDDDQKMAFLGTILSLTWRPTHLWINGEEVDTGGSRSMVYSDGAPVNFMRTLSAVPSSGPYLGLEVTHMAQIDDAKNTGFVCQINASDHRFKDKEWNYIPDVDIALPAVVIHNAIQINKTECLHRCLKATGCASLVFSEGEQHCILLYENRYTAQLIQGPGDWQYYDTAANEDECGISLLKNSVYEELSATSEYSADYAISQAIYGLRPNGTNTGGWRAATDDVSEHITVRFPAPVTISSIAVGGSYTDTDSGRVTEFSLFKISGATMVPIRDSFDNDQIFTGPYNNLLGVTHSLMSLPVGIEFVVQPVSYEEHVALNLELYGCLYVAAATCFSSTDPAIGTTMHCIDDWVSVLERNGAFSNPGLSPEKYRAGFAEANFTWIGTQQLFDITRGTIFNMRIEMWTENDIFYYAEYFVVQISDESDSFSLSIKSFRDGSHGDGGLIPGDGPIPFVTTDTLNENETDCATDGSAVYGWWIHWAQCNQTLLTADAGAQWLAQGHLPTDLTIVTMDKVIMKVMEADTTVVNVALRKPSFQSSSTYDASLANDGISLRNAEEGHCAQTNSEEQAWWKVDLLKEFRISSIEIHGREDCCYSDLHDFDVLVGTEDATEDFVNAGYELCAHYTGETTAAITHLPCTAPLLGQYLIILMTGPNEILTLCEVMVYTSVGELSALGEPCSWGGDCAARYTACVPTQGSRNGNYRCQCKPGYLETDLAQCLPVVDFSLDPGYIVYGEDTGLLRETTTDLTVHFNMTHGGGVSILSTPPNLTNFLLEVLITDGGTTPFNRNFSTDFTVTTGWDSRMGFLNSSVLSLAVSLEGSIPADSCHYASHVCFRVAPGDASIPVAYIDTDPSNDFAFFLLGSLICQPDIDIEVTSVRYISEIPVVRETNGLYVFRSTVSFMSGITSIAELHYDYNYAVDYVYSAFTLETMSTNNTEFPAQATNALRAGLGTGENITMDFTVTQTMAFLGCENITYICFHIYEDALSSFVDPDKSNNVHCTNISAFRICEPKMLVAIEVVQPAVTTYITRGYEDIVSISVTFTNADDVYDVPAVAAPDRNFNITAVCSGTPGRKRRSVDADVYSAGRARRSLLEVGPIVAESDPSMGAAMPRGESLTIDASFLIFLPRDLCDDLTDLCVAVEPAKGSSYSLYNGTNHIMCIEMDAYKNCLGLATEDVLFSPVSSWLAEGGETYINVSWSVGTDVHFTVDFQDGNRYVWIWNASVHTTSYKDFSTNVTHIYNTYANYTLHLNICSSVGCSDYYCDIIVEPPLAVHLTVDLDYTPKPPPTPVRYIIKHMNDTLSPVFARCILFLNDVDDDENATFSGAIDNIGIAIIHVYQEKKPTAFCDIFCENHVSNVTFNVTVALQENITDLVVTPLAPAITNTQSEIELTVLNGSNIVFQIAYGDTLTEIVDNSGNYEHQETFVVTHTYATAGNYTVSVNASNVHFSDWAVSEYDVIIQNEVTQLTVDCVTPVAYPPGNVTCVLSPDNSIAGPTDPFCDSKINGTSVARGIYLPQLSHGVPVNYNFNADRRHVSSATSIDLECYNLVSNQNLHSAVGIYEVIEGLGVDMDNMGLVAGEAGNLNFVVLNGSSIDFDIVFGDGHIISIGHPHLFGNEAPLVVSNTYTVIGNYTIAITATNPVSQVIETIAEPVVVQNRISELAHSASHAILWPRESVTYSLSVGAVQKELRNIHCSWYLNGDPFIYRYLEHPTPVEIVTVIEDVSRRHLGNLSINVTCSNLVSSISMLTSTHVILDAVILSALRSNGSVWWQNVSGFVLDIERFAEYSCFLWDMGGDDANFLYGLASCENLAVTNGWPFVEIHVDTTTLGHNYVYNDFGRYTVSVQAFNDVSNHTLQTKAVVWEWTCLTPNISVNLNDSDREHPVVKLRSQHFLIQMALETHCFYTWRTNDLWQFIETDNGNEYLVLTDTKMFIHYPRTLPYGLYEVMFSTQMRDFPETENSVAIYLEIAKTPLNVSIGGGGIILLDFGVIHVVDAISFTSDPDVEPGDLSGITFQWDCIQYNTSDLESIMQLRMDNYNDIFPSNRTEMCMVHDPQVSVSNAGFLTINTTNMYPMTWHKLTVTVTKDTRVSNFAQLLYNKPVSPPAIAISCRDNCAGKASSSRQIVLKLTCLDSCSSAFGDFQFRWLLYYLNSAEPIANLSTLTVNGVDQFSIFLRENSLPGGETYRMVAEGWTPGSEVATAQHVFKVNLIPYNGVCDVEPKMGIVSETEFILTCLDWLEWQPPAPFDLEYFFNVRQMGSIRLFPVFFGTQPVSAPVVFPVGSFAENFTLEAVIRIYDSVGDYAEFVIPVVVLPKPLPGDLVLQGVLLGVYAEEATVLSLLADNRPQEAATMLYAFISEINVPAEMYAESSDSSVDIAALRILARTWCIQVCTYFEVDSLGALLQNNEIMRTALLWPDEIEVNALAQASSHLSLLSSMTLDLNDLDEIHNPTLIAGDVLDTSVKVMIAAEFIRLGASSEVNDTELDVGAVDIFSQVSFVMENVVVIIDDVMGMLSEDMEAGDPSAVFVYDVLTVITAKVSTREFDELEFYSPHGRLDFPPIQNLLGANSPTCLHHQVLFSAINPFIYGPQRDSAVESTVVDFMLQSCDDTNDRDNSTDETTSNSLLQPSVPFTALLIPSEIDELDFFEMNVTSLDDYQYHVLELSEPNLPVQIDLIPHPWNRTYAVVIGLNTFPTLWSNMWFILLEYGMNATQTPDVRLMDDHYSIYLPASNLTNGTLRVAVSLPDCTRDTDLCPRESSPVILEYAMRVMEVTCQVWNDTDRIWSNHQCQMDRPVSQNQAVFTSNLFGSLGVGVFVGPNTIDFNTVFDNIEDKIIENLAVFLTVILIMLLYVPLVVICRKYDQRDKVKWLALPLIGTAENSPYRYELHIFTGFEKHSETESNIQLVIIGTRGDTVVLNLSDGIRKNFNRGDVNCFSFGVDHDLGGIYKIRIWHDNSGQGHLASWFLSKIIVVDVERSNWYLFLGNKWLAKDKGDGKTDCLLHVTSKDSLDSGYLLRTNVNRKFYEDHIWLSILFRQVYSSYNRAQRLSTAWALLFLTMIANAMWYKSSDDPSTDSVLFVVGIVSFTTHQLYSSFMSSIMVVPAVLVISFCFTKASVKRVNMEDSDSVSSRSSRRGSDKAAVPADDVSLYTKKELTQVRQPAGKWPYWTAYIAWILVFLSILASAFFTILYSFEWGGEKSTAWLISFLLSFVQSVIIIQPVKVMCVAMILTLMFRRDSDMNPYEERYGEMKDPMDVLCDQECAIQENPWSVVADSNLESLRGKQHLDKCMVALLKDIGYQIIFVVLLLSVCYSNQDVSIYRQNESLRNHFLGKIELASNRKTTWTFLEDTVLPNMFWNNFGNGEPVGTYESQFLVDMSGFRLGQPRLRQTRVIQELCRIPLVFQNLCERCTYGYSRSSPPLDNADYLPEWKIPINSSAIIYPILDYQSGFLFSTADDINGAPLWANLHSYDGGGYVAVLGNTLEEGLQTLDKLEEAKWIDQYTRALFVEFSVLNSNSNLFSMITLVFEFPTVGGLFKFHTFDTIQLYRYIGGGGLVVLAVEIISFLFFISVIYKVLRQCIKDRLSFVCSLWGVSHIIVVLAFLVAVALYSLRSVWTVTTLEEVMNNRDRGVSFSRVVMVDSGFMLMMALVCFLAQIQLLHVLRYSRSIRVMSSTIINAKGDLTSLGLFAVIVILGISSLAHMLYGPSLEAYHTLPTAFMTLCVNLIGKFDMESHNEAGGLGAKIFLTLYLLAGIIVLMDFFITLLNEFLSEVQSDAHSRHPEQEVMDHLISNLNSFFCYSGSVDSRGQESDQHPPEELIQRKSVALTGKKSRSIIVSD